VPDTPSSRGMIAKVQHLVRVHEPPAEKFTYPVRGPQFGMAPG
jgi:hypothetical protein